MAFLWFFLGLMLGSIIGIFMMALIVSAHQADAALRHIHQDQD